MEKGSFREGVSVGKRKWYSLIDKIWALPNLLEAFKEVEHNRGAAGVDGVTIAVFKAELEDNVRVLQLALRDKTYKPKPVRRVYIPKADGTQRPLGIPCVADRVVQAAMKRILEPIFEPTFMECSFGFRPGRSAHMALDKIRKDLREGYVHVIDADLKLAICREIVRKLDGEITVHSGNRGNTFTVSLPIEFSDSINIQY